MMVGFPAAFFSSLCAFPFHTIIEIKACYSDVKTHWKSAPGGLLLQCEHNNYSSLFERVLLVRVLGFEKYFSPFCVEVQDANRKTIILYLYAKIFRRENEPCCDTKYAQPSSTQAFTMSTYLLPPENSSETRKRIISSLRRMSFLRKMFKESHHKSRPTTPKPQFFDASISSLFSLNAPIFALSLAPPGDWDFFHPWPCRAGKPSSSSLFPASLTGAE